MQGLKKTALFSLHKKLEARMVPFAGYAMPVQYQGVLEEARCTRKSVGLFDVSHMGQVSLRGKGALDALQLTLTNDLRKIVPHQAQYNLMCNASGGVIDDLIVYHREEDHIYLCVNAANREKDVEWLKSTLPSHVSVEDESDETSLIAVQGPTAEVVLQAATDFDLSTLRYYFGATMKIFGQDTFVSRTGYTGEDGFELYIPNTAAPRLWENLLESGNSQGIQPCGLGARDTLRLEMGYPLHGNEIGESLSPLEAGLSWVIKLKKGAFTGSTALERQVASGLPRQLRGLLIEDRRIARAGYTVYTQDGAETGTVTSGTFSPHREAPIALAWIRREHLEHTRFLVGIRDGKVPAVLCPLPFVPSRVKR